ncbi:hypothetical protein L226DRAFT_461728 [Lentinus tigrinus ALCF2SS1-7]|uniref:uncharacterized protein n=1 Tax=Lentinus tigrinus ALCF2SS1-7 TaxID=1328758 RepID=UPI001165CCE2|nr:hypothetical protein L226DRAFT_461728 [Lentinus tigrinus ALCF2SS1-7]
MTLLDLPPEILIAVLVHVDFRTVLHCRQVVCALLKNLVDDDTSLQYIIELGAAGMEDGPSSTLTPSARLALLRERQSAWKSLTWRSEATYPMTIGEYWELYGGVLAQEEGGKKLVFRQLPSAIRGIEAREWEIRDAGTDIQDFSMDPAQDLLVVVEERIEYSETTCSLHLKSLLTGAPHPDVTGSAVLTHQTFLQGFTYSLRIAGDYVGTVLSGELEEPSELVVWNWRTGDRKLCVGGYHFSSFTFLSPRHILLAAFGDVNHPEYEISGWDDPKKPRILVLDLDVVSPQPVQLRDLEFTCEFLYPELRPTCGIGGMAIRSDPAPHAQPHPSLRVPFSVVREERLFAISLHFREGLQRPTLLSLVPSSTLFRSLSSIPHGQTRHTFTWADWGPTGSRFYRTPRATVNVVWICYVYGMSFVYLSSVAAYQTVVVLDFNQREIRRASDVIPDRPPVPDFSSGSARLVTEAMDLGTTRLFKDAVQTSLPFWERSTVNFDREREGQINAAMIDEDSLVLVSSVSSMFGRRSLQ